nr:hypothetical protein BaRGS_017749 [Batillaria attramentaria]
MGSLQLKHYKTQFRTICPSGFLESDQHLFLVCTFGVLKLLFSPNRNLLNYFCKSSIDIGPEADGTEEGKRRNEDDWCLTVALPARPV